MCLASPWMALKISGRDHCIMNMHVAVTDRYILSVSLDTAPSSSPLISTCPAAAGVFDTGPSGSSYLSLSFLMRTGCVNFTDPHPGVSRAIVNLLPTYSVSSPSCLHVNAFSKSHWTCSTKFGGPSTMMSSTHAMNTINSPFYPAKIQAWVSF